MSEWWTYSLTDFLLFSPRTYYRLFELYNESVWPAHIPAIALGFAILWLIRRNDGRIVAAILAAAWLWTAIAFHLERYATINWAAIYFAGAFVVQAALLLVAGARNALDFTPTIPQADRAAITILLIALVIQPAIGPLLDRGWTQAEVFGIAPDPTAVATLAVLVRARRVHWHLLVIPVLWCAFTGLTLWAMEATDALVAPTAAALALVIAAWKTLRPTTRAAP
jgi:hypothetical protein